MDTQVEVKVTIQASPAEVYRALTEGDQLTQWFAEHADVSLAEERYDFWGSLTPGSPEREQGRHTIQSYQLDKELKYELEIRGEATIVYIQLTEEGPGTMLRLAHMGLPARKHGQYSLADFWMLSLENLRAWVESSKVGMRCDFSAIQFGDVHLEVDIDAPAATVFETLINPAELRKYMSDDPQIEAQVGGKYELRDWDSHGPQKILELEQDKSLTYTWEYPKEPDTVVTWTLEGSGGKTRLTLVHSGFGSDRSGEDYQVGWLQFLNNIKFLSERGDAWQKVESLVADH